jgi:uncharacterized protein YfaQ (DUF2300 family)
MLTPPVVESIMKTKNLILASLIAVAAVPAFAAGVQNKDPYTNGQAVTKADPYTDGARKADVYTDGAVRKADPYTDGALRKADPYTDGALVGKADPFSDGQ